MPEAAAITNPFGPVEDVTLRRLLMHTSGMQGEHPTEDPESEPFGSIADLVRDLPKVRIVIPPDTQTKYCNIAFQLLGAVVERLSGQAFADYVSEHLLVPLGLARTRVRRRAGRARGGLLRPPYSDHLPPANVYPSGLFEADGGLWSCVDDLARWSAFWLGNGTRGGARAHHARRDAAAVDRRERDWTEAQGLCFYWARRGDERYVGHAGGLHGFITRFALSPKDGVGAIALLNGMGDANALAFDLLDHVVAAQRARPLPQPEPPAPLPAAYAALLGRYHWEEFAEVFVVEWRDGALMLVDAEGEAFRLDPTDDPLRFVVRGGRAGRRRGAVPARRRRPRPPAQHRRLPARASVAGARPSLRGSEPPTSSSPRSMIAWPPP